MRKRNKYLCSLLAWRFRNDESYENIQDQMKLGRTRAKQLTQRDSRPAHNLVDSFAMAKAAMACGVAGVVIFDTPLQVKFVLEP
jgi:hypothetical protein